MSRLLFQRFPSLADLPFVPLAEDLPTPVEPLVHLSKHWRLPNLFMKREDLTSSLYGGNKVRKLEFLLADAIDKKKKSILTTGAYGSHHAVATSLFAAKLGLKTTLILVPQPPSEHVQKNYQVCVAAGARALRVPWTIAYPLYRAIGVIRALMSGEGFPYVIPPGGSNALGTLGYVETGLELGMQIANGDCPVPDYVYTAVGSCSTLAGLGIGLGLAAQDLPTLRKVRLVGIRVVPKIVTSLMYVRFLQRRTLRLLGRWTNDIPNYNPSVAMEILGTQLGKGYGHATEEGKKAQKQIFEYEGVDSELTYTAKALAGIHAFATEDAQKTTATHLYIHTLGRIPQ